MSSAPYVIVGGGLAASKAAQTLRDEGFEGDLVVVTGEAHRPYERPPLSKDYLRGEADRSAVFTVDEDWYAQNAELRTGEPATGLDTGAKRLTLADGSTLDYGKLLIATGSSPRPLPIPGADLQGVHLLRTVEQSDLLHAAIKDAEHVAIVGDGWIGMEVAASARQLGREVTVFGLGAQPLERVLGPEMGLVFGRLHTDHGVELLRRTEVAKILGEAGKAVGVETEETKAAQTAGGYAKEMSDDFRRRQAELMAETVKKQDIVICTALTMGRSAPKIISAEMVASMKPGSVIVDIASDAGGNCALTRPGERVVTENGVTILGWRNWPGRIAVAASALYARNLLTFLTAFWDKEAKTPNLKPEDEIVQGVALTRGGAVVHPQFADKPAAAA